MVTAEQRCRDLRTRGRPRGERPLTILGMEVARGLNNVAIHAHDMGAFIGYGDTGVWANNRERDAFLDWNAAHRCQPHDERWEYCKSEAQRWTGRCIQLDELIPRVELFEVSDTERAGAATEFWPHVAP